MSSEKYIGLDVHQATISVAVMDSQGKVVMESIVETKACTLLEFFAGLRGSLLVTFEEGTWAAWLYDLLKPHVTEVLVCNPRKILAESVRRVYEAYKNLGASDQVAKGVDLLGQLKSELQASSRRS